MSHKNPRIPPISITNPLIENYCFEHSAQIPQELYEIEQYTKAHILAHRMLGNHLQAHVLITISKMLQPQKILEIGTFTGYSSICLAQGLSPNGQFITIEKKAEFVRIAQRFFQKYNYSFIEIIHGDAFEVIKQLHTSFDLIYLDADKERYPQYLQILLALLNKNGWLVVDNTLWKGLVVEPPKELITQSMQQFNDYLKQLEPRIYYTILPVKDGITLIQKIE